MRTSTKRWRCAVIVVGIALGFLLSGIAQAAVVFPRDSVQFGRTYSEWAAEWWQWALSIPVETHPLFDNGDCSVGQSGPVFFLGGKFCSSDNPSCNSSVVTRTCVVPFGKTLFFPIVNTENALLEAPLTDGHPSTLVDLRAFSQFILDDATDLSATIDRVPIHNLKEQFREQSPAFGFTLPADNLFNAIGEGPFPGGAYFPSVDDGVYLMVAPLSVGNHKIHFTGRFPSFGNFSFDVTYDLTVALK
jgi:hypothetical protein